MKIGLLKVRKLSLLWFVVCFFLMLMFFCFCFGYGMDEVMM